MDRSVVILIVIGIVLLVVGTFVANVLRVIRTLRSAANSKAIKLVAQIQRTIASLAVDGRIEYFEKIKIHRTGIKSYQKNAGTCVITLQTAIEYLHYIKQNGIVVSGSQQTFEQDRYDLSIIYIQDASQLPSYATNAISINCPNCGAPVKGLGNKHCDYCGSAIQAIDIRIWRINQFTLS